MTSDSLIKEARERVGISEMLSIRETNVTYLFLVLVSLLSCFLIEPLINSLSYAASIGLAIAFFLLIIVFFSVGKASYKKHEIMGRVLYYSSFLCGMLSVMCSLLAIINKQGFEVDSHYVFVGFCVLAALLGLDMLILSVGKKERMLFALTSLLILGAVIFGAYVGSKSNGAGVIVGGYAFAFLLLHLTMLMYVCSGGGFFELMSLTYYIVALIAVVVALVVGGGDASCDGADCVDCAPGGGGRRAKARRATEMLREINPVK